MEGNSLEYVRAIASDVFNMLAEDEPCAVPSESIDDWDSIQRLNLVLALEEHFRVEFAPEEIECMKTLSDIAKVLGEKQGLE